MNTIKETIDHNSINNEFDVDSGNAVLVSSPFAFADSFTSSSNDTEDSFNGNDDEDEGHQHQQRYESILYRMSVRNVVQDDENEDDTAAQQKQTPKERFQSAVNILIALNRFKDRLAIEKEEESSNYDVASITTHRRNAGKYTIVAFVNSKSGGGKGSSIYDALIQHLGKDNVFDLFQCSSGRMPQDILLPYARDDHVRVLVCGGDGTVGWIASSIDKVWQQIIGKYTKLQSTKYKHNLPIAILPLGSGNDLSRQFRWGSKYKSKMKSIQAIRKVEDASVQSLDRWRCLVLPRNTLTEESKAWVPQMLGRRSTALSTKSVRQLGTFMFDTKHATNLTTTAASYASKSCLPPKAETTLPMPEARKELFDGVFSNYFSIGFDAKITFQFHKERLEKPEKFKSPLINKIKYVQNSKHGLFASTIRNKVQLLVLRNGELQELKLPKNCRAIILLNIQNYAAGNDLSGKGSCNDGLMEVLFVSSITRLATNMAIPFVKFKIAIQTSVIQIRLNKPIYCQVDGEPWYQDEGVVHISHYCSSPFLRKQKKPTKTKKLLNCRLKTKHK